MAERKHRFDRFASWASKATGHGMAFTAAALVTAAWAASGPLFHFSDTWQLVINTGTTVTTFMMVFLIQNSINRDSAAVHVKLDELLRVTGQARDALVGSEHLSEQEIEEVRRRIERQAEEEEAGERTSA